MMNPRRTEQLRRYAAESAIPMSPRRLNFYGHFAHGRLAKRARLNRLSDDAIRGTALWDSLVRRGVRP